MRTCCYILQYVVAICNVYYILHTFSHDSSLGGIAALLRRPRFVPIPSGSDQLQAEVVQQQQAGAAGQNYINK